MPAHEFGRHMADVEVDIVEAQPLDFMVDRARDDITRGKLFARVETRHEARAAAFDPRRQLELPALAAHGLGDQEILDLEIVEARRVELHEFHVRDAAARAPCHRDAVARRATRRGRKQIAPPRAAGRQDRRGRGQRLDAPGRAVEGVDAPNVAVAAAPAATCDLALGDQVDRDHVGHQHDVRVGGGGFFERLLHRPAGGIVDMDDAAVTVPALARQVKRTIARGAVGVERHAERDQPLDRGGRAFDHAFDRRADV